MNYMNYIMDKSNLDKGKFYHAVYKILFEWVGNTIKTAESIYIRWNTREFLCAICITGQSCCVHMSQCQGKFYHATRDAVNSGCSTRVLIFAFISSPRFCRKCQKLLWNDDWSDSISSVLTFKHLFTNLMYLHHSNGFSILLNYSQHRGKYTKQHEHLWTLMKKSHKELLSSIRLYLKSKWQGMRIKYKKRIKHHSIVSFKTVSKSKQ